MDPVDILQARLNQVPWCFVDVRDEIGLTRLLSDYSYIRAPLVLSTGGSPMLAYTGAPEAVARHLVKNAPVGKVFHPVAAHDDAGIVVIRGTWSTLRPADVRPPTGGGWMPYDFYGLVAQHLFGYCAERADPSLFQTARYVVHDFVTRKPYSKIASTWGMEECLVRRIARLLEPVLPTEMLCVRTTWAALIDRYRQYYRSDKWDGGIGKLLELARLYNCRSELGHCPVTGVHLRAHVRGFIVTVVATACAADHLDLLQWRLLLNGDL